MATQRLDLHGVCKSSRHAYGDIASSGSWLRDRQPGLRSLPGSGSFLADRLSPERRRFVGLGLVVFGAVTTIPAARWVFRGFRNRPVTNRVESDPRLVGAERFPRKGDDEFWRVPWYTLLSPDFRAIPRQPSSIAPLADDAAGIRLRFRA